ncbi:MAG: peptide chain release factor N(5)-glutamine methyltransferase [Ignavibacteriales bacterium]
MNKELINYGINKLKEIVNEEEANYLANYLFQYIDDVNNYKDGIEKLLSGIPIQYVIGNVDFYGNIFNVNSNVLIPRFETEELIEKTVEYINDYFNHDIDIVDLGTGSGCIAITLQKTFPNSKVDAVDISDKALEVAKNNAKINNVSINYYLGDLFSTLTKKYDLIISNPPYLSVNDDVMDIVKKNEPNIALYANNDGLEVIENILRNVNNYLKPKGMIALEIGNKQGKMVKELASKYLKDAKVVIEKDLQNRDRFAFIFISN